jgi:hypothetical protein
MRAKPTRKILLAGKQRKGYWIWIPSFRSDLFVYVFCMWLCLYAFVLL